MRFTVVRALVVLLFGCNTAASTATTPDASAEDAARDVDASLPNDAGSRMPDCSLPDEDRDDAGFALMKVDRSKLGAICWTYEGGQVASCPSDVPCVAYRLPEDPPGAHRCGPGCDAVTCPGEHVCTESLSGLPSVGCDCPF